MFSDHRSFEQPNFLGRPPRSHSPGNEAEHGAERSKQLAAERASDRPHDETDKCLEKLHQDLRIERRICRNNMSASHATIGLTSNAPSGGTTRRIGSTIQSVRMYAGRIQRE